jgi:hypothetical protein
VGIKLVHELFACGPAPSRARVHDLDERAMTPPRDDIVGDPALEADDSRSPGGAPPPEEARGPAAPSPARRRALAGARRLPSCRSRCRPRRSDMLRGAGRSSRERRSLRAGISVSQGRSPWPRSARPRGQRGGVGTARRTPCGVRRPRLPR